MVHVKDMLCRDAFIIPCEEEKKYYLIDFYGNKDRGISIRESLDLINWSEASICFQPDDDFWGKFDMWAPECHYWRGKYYLVSSFRAKGGYRGCQFLVSEQVNGPYRPMADHPVTPDNWHCLDGTLYEDRMGRPWMVFCHEWAQVQDGQMCAIRLSDDLAESIGEPVILFRASEAPWKFTDDQALWKLTTPQPRMGWGRITDGPFMYRAKNGELLMLWSSYSNTAYTTGYARSRSGEIFGPWVQEPEPLYSQDGGHSMMFTRFDGTLMMALHSPNIPGKERLLLFEMEDCCGKLHIVNEITGNWISKRYHKDGTGKTCFLQ